MPMTLLAMILALSTAASPSGRNVPTAFSERARLTSRLTSEQTAREFLYALYANDLAGYHRLIVPEPGADSLIGRQSFTTAQLQRLRRDVDALQLTRRGGFRHEGTAVSGNEASYPDGTKTVYETEFRGVVMAIPTVRSGGEWRVDVRFWLEMRRMAEANPAETDPDMRAKEFLFYIITKQPEHLAALSATPVDGKALTKANDLRAGDLDQLASLCTEMPVVRARSGEGFLMPSGQVVRAGAQRDTLVMVGLFGPTEVPFVVVKKGGQWKVVPARYFEMLRAAQAL